MLELNLLEKYVNSKPLSHNDKHFLTTMKEGFDINNGHYEMLLPFRDSSIIFQTTRNWHANGYAK